MTWLAVHEALKNPRVPYLGYVILFYVLSGALNWLFRTRTPEQWDAFRVSHRYLAAAREWLRAVGFDSPKAILSLVSLLTGQPLPGGLRPLPGSDPEPPARLPLPPPIPREDPKTVPPKDPTP